MAQAKNGDKVKVHYTGKFEDGNVFDSSREREPLEVQLGAGQVIPGFEKGIAGMEVGASKTITLEPDEAYGSRRDELSVEVNRSDFPDNIIPEKGQYLQIKQPDGSLVDVLVTEVGDEKVTLDANHPLAGKKLTFEIELVEIV